jgi:hypothetical protein
MLCCTSAVLQAVSFWFFELQQGKEVCVESPTFLLLTVCYITVTVLQAVSRQGLGCGRARSVRRANSVRDSDQHCATITVTVLQVLLGGGLSCGKGEECAQSYC